MTEQEMLARIADLERQLQNKTKSARIKISEKGGVSFYGTGRYPVTLYKSQWEILASAIPDIMSFIQANDHLLSQKEQDKAARQATA